MKSILFFGHVQLSALFGACFLLASVCQAASAPEDLSCGPGPAFHTALGKRTPKVGPIETYKSISTATNAAKPVLAEPLPGEPSDAERGGEAVRALPGAG